MSADPAWSAAQRLEGLAGEVRINLIRLVALVAFYGHHLVNVFMIRDNPALQGAYHTVVTSLVLAWALAVLVIHYCLMRRWLPRSFKYIVTAWDILLITTLLMVGGDARSMLATYPAFKEWVVHNKTVPISILRILAADPDPKVRFTVAMKRKCEPKILERLAKDVDETIRARVTYNRTTPAHVLAILKNDSSLLVMEAVANRLKH